MWQHLQRESAGAQAGLDRLSMEDINAREAYGQLQEQARQFDVNADLKMADDARQDVRMATTAFNNTVMQLWREGGEIPPEVYAVLDRQRRQLTAAGVPDGLLNPLPQGKTLRATDTYADNARADTALTHRMELDWAKFDQHADEFDQEFKQKQSQFIANQNDQKRKFDEDVRQFNLKNQQGYYRRDPKAADADASKALKKADGSIDNLDARIGGVEGELRQARSELSRMGKDDLARYDLERRIEVLEGRHTNLLGMRDQWFAKKRELLPPIETIRKQAKTLIEKGLVDPDKMRAKFRKDYGVEL
jgi:hypothetical protein